MAKGEITIDEKACKGCGLCAVFCSLGCIEMSQDRLSSSGLPLPSIVQPEKCTGCMRCIGVCPSDAIMGERKKPHDIDPDKCIKCGSCLSSCKFEAIMKA